jgi:uncharacterized membrane protein
MFSLTVASPAFLWMLPLAALPILFHLFLKVRKQTRDFPSLMFFLKADPRLSARRRLREWLALVLRTLLIAFLLLALSRPLWLGGGGRGPTVSVLVLDNSASMSGLAADGRPKRDHALDAAAALVGDLGPGDSAAIVLLVDDVAAAMPDGITADREKLRSALGRVRETHAPGNPSRAMRQVASLLKDASQARAEIHILTDLQENEWAQATEPMALPAGARVTVHRVDSPAPTAANVSVTGVEWPHRRLLAGRRAFASLSLQNTTAYPARIRVNGSDESGAKFSQEVDVPARAAQIVPVPVEARQPGPGWVKLWIENDAFAPDNGAALAYTCHARKPVVFWGAPRDFGLLPRAIAPSADGALSGLVPVFKSLATAPWAETAEAPVLLVTSWSGLAAAAAHWPMLRGFVEGGGVLLVCAAAGSQSPPGPVPDWLGAEPDAPAAYDRGFPALALNRQAPIWDDLRDDAGQVLIRQVKVFTFCPLRPADGTTPLIGLEDGRVVLAQCELGQGVVFSAGVAFDATASTLPLKGSFLALAQGMALRARSADENPPPRVAGTRLPAADGADDPIRIRSLEAGDMDWRGLASLAPEFVRSGVYSVQRGTSMAYLAVRSADSEGVFRFLPDAPVPALGAGPHRVNRYASREAFLTDIRRLRSGVDLMPLLLILALLAAAAESWIVNPLATRTGPFAGAKSTTATKAPDLAAMLPVGAITWMPHLSPVVSALVIVLVGIGLWALYRRMSRRMSARRARLLVIPRGIVLILLVLALFDPAWTRSVPTTVASRVVALVDTSSSMDFKDDGQQSRVERARAAAERLRRALPSSVEMQILEFDTGLREPDRQEADKPTTGRGTDIGGCLLALSRRADLSGQASVVLLTDGGDEPVTDVDLSAAALHVVGVGSDLSAVDDLSINELQAPASVEKDVSFEIIADLTARAASAGFKAGLVRVRASLEHEQDGQWLPDAEESVNLATRNARVRLKASCPSDGARKYRVSVDTLPGETWLANNRRTFTVDVRKRASHVLFFARDLGSELKMLRSELSSDPGLTFTALFRTTGERFTVQGERFPGDEGLDAGFPEDSRQLAAFDCIILGSPVTGEWREAAVQALVRRVEEGGALILLGGESSRESAVAPSKAWETLLPWAVPGGSAELLRGEFPVAVAPGATDHPIVAGLDPWLQQVGGTVESLNRTGPLKPGATAILTALADQRAVPLVAIQRVGKGQTLAIASNTMWQWARQSDAARKAYGLFWRQAVRNLTGTAEIGQVLSVKWDKPSYRPGQKATVDVRVIGPAAERDIQLTAAVTFGDRTVPVPVEPVQGQAGALVARLTFEQRGIYVFSLGAREGDKKLESYEKTLSVAPLLDEGTRLELDRPGLTQLAKRGGGLFVPDGDLDPLAKAIAAKHRDRMTTTDIPLVTDGLWFALLFVLALVAEWTLRRKANLL